MKESSEIVFGVLNSEGLFSCDDSISALELSFIIGIFDIDKDFV